ncbi:mucin-2-like isoform X2 [Oncorhynchus masou masou]
MLPGNSFHGSTGQSSSSPYTVTVNQTNYQPGDTIQVTLSGTFTYKGFLLVAHEEGQNKPVGTFSLGSGTRIILVPCNGIAASGVSQNNNLPRSSVTVTWTAPSSSSLGNIIVKSTFMQTSSVFWIAVPSVTVNRRASAVTTTRAQTTTTTDPTTTTTVPTTTTTVPTTTTTVPTTTTTDPTTTTTVPTTTITDPPTTTTDPTTTTTVPTTTTTVPTTTTTVPTTTTTDPTTTTTDPTTTTTYPTTTTTTARPTTTNTAPPTTTTVPTTTTTDPTTTTTDPTTTTTDPTTTTTDPTTTTTDPTTTTTIAQLNLQPQQLQLLLQQLQLPLQQLQLLLQQLQLPLQQLQLPLQQLQLLTQHLLDLSQTVLNSTTMTPTAISATPSPTPMPPTATFAIPSPTPLTPNTSTTPTTATATTPLRLTSLRERKRYSRPMGCDVRDDPRKCTYISVTTYPPFIVEISAPAETLKGYLGIISEMLTNQIKFESVIVVYESGTFTVQKAFYNGATFINKTQLEVTDKELAYDPNIKILQLNFIIPDHLTPLLLKMLTLTPRCVIDTGLQKVFFVRGSVEDNGDLGSPSITLLTGLSSQVSSSCRKPLFHGLLMTLVCWNLFNLLP